MIFDVSYYSDGISFINQMDENLVASIGADVIYSYVNNMFNRKEKDPAYVGVLFITYGIRILDIHFSIFTCCPDFMAFEMILIIGGFCSWAASSFDIRNCNLADCFLVRFNED